MNTSQPKISLRTAQKYAQKHGFTTTEVRTQNASFAVFIDLGYINDAGNWQHHEQKTIGALEKYLNRYGIPIQYSAGYTSIALHQTAFEATFADTTLVPHGCHKIVTIPGQPVQIK